MAAARRRFTRAEYYRMAEAGILRWRDRVELIRGEIVEMSPSAATTAPSWTTSTICLPRGESEMLSFPRLWKCAHATAPEGDFIDPPREVVLEPERSQRRSSCIVVEHAERRVVRSVGAECTVAFPSTFKLTGGLGARRPPASPARISPSTTAAPRSGAELRMRVPLAT